MDHEARCIRDGVDVRLREVEPGDARGHDLVRLGQHESISRRNRESDHRRAHREGLHAHRRSQNTPPFKLAVHVEAAPIDYTEGGAALHQITPVWIKVTVKDNAAWELSGKCVDGPNYKMPSIGPDGGLITPLGMIEECQISERYLHSGILTTSSWAVGFSINVHGDGTLKTFPADDIKVE